MHAVRALLNLSVEFVEFIDVPASENAEMAGL
jgi:hypothetical protein